ncbi:unnamed protein product [Orchesella dallaii]|uniref:Uncharacterized protein n=1 Tax=Orchesella dallaii TaxID=48710 RepID=A0ABP1RCP0_9HEXA
MFLFNRYLLTLIIFALQLVIIHAIHPNLIPLRKSASALIEGFKNCNILIILSEANPKYSIISLNQSVNPTVTITKLFVGKDMYGWLPKTNPGYHFLPSCYVTLLFAEIVNEKTVLNSSLTDRDFSLFFAETPIVDLKAQPQFLIAFTVAPVKFTRPFVKGAVNSFLRSFPDIFIAAMKNDGSIVQINYICRICGMTRQFTQLKINLRCTKNIDSLKSCATEMENLSKLESDITAYFWFIDNRTLSFKLAKNSKLSTSKTGLGLAPKEALKMLRLGETLRYIMFEDKLNCNPYNFSVCTKKAAQLRKDSSLDKTTKSSFRFPTFPSLNEMKYNAHFLIKLRSKNRIIFHRDGLKHFTTYRAYFNFLTCDGVKPEKGFQLYGMPFDKETWILIFISIVLFGLAFELHTLLRNSMITINIFEKSRNKKIEELFKVVGRSCTALLDQPLPPSILGLFQGSKSFPFVIGLWWLYSVILTNAYKSVFTTEVIIPLKEASPWTRFDQVPGFKIFAPDNEFTRMILAILKPNRVEIMRGNWNKTRSLAIAYGIVYRNLNMYKQNSMQAQLRAKQVSFQKDFEEFVKYLTDENCEKRIYVDIHENIDTITNYLNNMKNLRHKFAKGEKDLIFVKEIGWTFHSYRQNHPMNRYRRLVPSGIILFWEDLYKRFKPSKYYSRIIPQRKEALVKAKYWGKLNLDRDSQVLTVFYIWMIFSAICILGFAIEVIAKYNRL